MRPDLRRTPTRQRTAILGRLRSSTMSPTGLIWYKSASCWSSAAVQGLSVSRRRPVEWRCARRLMTESSDLPSRTAQVGSMRRSRRRRRSESSSAEVQLVDVVPDSAPAPRPPAWLVPLTVGAGAAWLVLAAENWRGAFERVEVALVDDSGDERAVSSCLSSVEPAEARVRTARPGIGKESERRNS